MKHRQFNLSDEERQAIEQRERETRDALELRRLQGVRMYGSGLEMPLVRQVTGAARRLGESLSETWLGRLEAGLEGGEPS